MPDNQDNYWGIDFTRQSLKTLDSAPVALLRQQAEKLKDVTNDIVEGQIKEGVEGDEAFASLYIGSRSLGDYLVRLLTVSHPVIADPSNPSPITVTDFSDDEGTVLPNMTAFDVYLRSFLSSGPVRGAIGNLIKFSRSKAQP